MEQPPTEPGTQASGRGAAGRSGLIPLALLRYLEARGVLFTIEGREAALELAASLIRGAVAAIFALTGWLLLMAGAAGWWARSAGWPWSKAAVFLGLIHLALAGAAAFAVSRRLTGARWFEQSLNEFAKDRAWLAQLNDRE